MAKTIKKQDVEKNEVVVETVKIHLSKYFVLHSMTSMQKAFLTASPFRAEMHTEAEWKKIINNALNRRVK